MNSLLYLRMDTFVLIFIRQMELIILTVSKHVKKELDSPLRGSIYNPSCRKSKEDFLCVNYALK